MSIFAGDKITHKITFIEIYELKTPEGRVVMFQIPAAQQGISIAFMGFYYGRLNESLVGLNIGKITNTAILLLGKDETSSLISPSIAQ